MKVFSLLNPRPFRPSPAGVKFIDEVILDEVERKLVRTDLRTDIKAMINSYASQVDIQKLLKIRDVSGDDSVLFKKQGFYVDSRNMPKNQQEVYRAILNADKVFKKLPDDVRKEYKSFNDFCSRADFLTVISKYCSDGSNNIKSDVDSGKGD